ncbi:MAG: Coenzyme F420 hydrogenase/dehydrogenase, beta subunit C-terminal domain, partial [Lachnospiraceae bacterium]|nr:Coenzyme F420 hydrogenase/dehydrogenase, beta subunit C-terminal domain [Lachnospiraceae bacterium]
MKNECNSITNCIKEEQCVGCGACVSICPVDALAFKKDKWGYYVPELDRERCINCGKCVTTCPVYSHRESENAEDTKAYCFVSVDKELLEKSSSGGVFSHLSRIILKDGGLVFGVEWTKEHTAKHAAISDEEDLYRFQKSKYMQSYTGTIFRNVKAALLEGKKVLFSGCPCQVAGLKQYLGKAYVNLYLIDLLCGNSPSAEFFKTYVKEEFDDDLKSYEFRYKAGAWRSDCEQINLISGDSIVRTGMEADSYQSVYHDHTMCAPHCENCMFHSIPRYGDLSIGDFWGISRFKPDLDTSSGVSVVLVNNEKGTKLFDLIPKNEIGLLDEVPLDWIGGNGYLGKNSSNFISPFRDLFYKEYLLNGFHAAVNAVDRERSAYMKLRYLGDFNLLRDWMMLKQSGVNPG